jgi:predicted kinase
MTILFLMVGVPGSGKSTLIESAFSGATVICPDSKIGYTRESPWTPQAAKRAWDEARHALDRALKGKDRMIVFDATLVSTKKRKHYIQLARQYGIKIAAVYCSNTKVAKERNEIRDEFRRVPAETFDRMVGNLVAPTEEEGFDFIVEYDGINIRKAANRISESLRKCG